MEFKINHFPDDIYNYITDDNNLPKVYLIIGGPGCGKGTQCSIIKERFDMVHLSIGDALRNERELNTELGKAIDYYMTEFDKNGRLMPWEITFNMLFRKMIDAGWNKKPFLIDGFIKDFTILKKWDIYVRPLVDLKLVIYLECGIEEMRKRLKIRSLTSNRKDEGISEIRLKTFIERTLPSLDYFKEKKNNFLKVNAEKDKFEVAAEIENKLITLC